MPARVGSSLLTSGNWTALACRGLPAILINSDYPGTRGAIKTRCLVFSSQAVAVSPPARQALAWLSRRTAGPSTDRSNGRRARARVSPSAVSPTTWRAPSPVDLLSPLATVDQLSRPGAGGVPGGGAIRVFTAGSARGPAWQGVATRAGPRHGSAAHRWCGPRATRRLLGQLVVAFRRDFLPRWSSWPLAIWWRPRLLFLPPWTVSGEPCAPLISSQGRRARLASAGFIRGFFSRALWRLPLYCFFHDACLRADLCRLGYQLLTSFDFFEEGHSRWSSWQFDQWHCVRFVVYMFLWTVGSLALSTSGLWTQGTTVD